MVIIWEGMPTRKEVLEMDNCQLMVLVSIYLAETIDIDRRFGDRQDDLQSNSHPHSIV